MEIKELADQLLNSPVLIEVAPRNAVAESAEQLIHPVYRVRKRELLSLLIASNHWRHVYEGISSIVSWKVSTGAARLADHVFKTEVLGKLRT
jgi:ATP-dependent RNA helicase RhlE